MIASCPLSQPLFADFAISPSFVPFFCDNICLWHAIKPEVFLHATPGISLNNKTKTAVVFLDLTLPRNNSKGDCNHVHGPTSEGFPISENPPVNIILVLMFYSITEV